LEEAKQAMTEENVAQWSEYIELHNNETISLQIY
jgi:hypothetical protein